ncbi:MAG: M20 family metallopeptidase [Candidatus Kapabacteria bacterium]|nr:M20 family metallopeptidase [Candidatus Kapabacteria bacterium]
MKELDFSFLDNYLIDTRRYFHQYPETAFKEFETTKMLEGELDKLGIPHKRIIETGVIGLIGDPTKPCVALRGDIDGLPISEETGLPFSSKHAGRMHACGHDFHMTMVLGAAKYLKSIEDELPICVKLIFQPGEEMIPGGAKLMIEAGVLENPTPRFVFGQHIHPAKDVGRVEVCYGPAMASADELYWTVKGKFTHAATPHLGHDPILASSYMIAHLQDIITKFRNPLNPGVLSITSIHGGTATNILPDEVKLMGTFRAFNNEWRYKTIENIGIVSQKACEIYGCEANFAPRMGFPPVINDQVASDIVKSSAVEALDSEHAVACEPIMWGEDFAYYGENIPACFWFLGVKNCEDMPPLHNSKLAPDERALRIGAEVLIRSAINSYPHIQ